MTPPAAGGAERSPAIRRPCVIAQHANPFTRAVMIGAFYIAEQYLQRVAGFSALGASGALVLVALLVGAAAPMAGRLVDRHGEQLPALLGFGVSGPGAHGPRDPGGPVWEANTSG